MQEAKQSKRKIGAASDKRSRIAAEIQFFAKKYARKAQKDCEPNDRKYDRSIERRVKQIKPEELDWLMRMGEDE